MTPTLDTVIALAQHAGAILRAAYGRHLQIDHKGTIDLVTDADRRSEDYLIGEVRRQFPDHRIEAEESGLTPGRTDRTWYIDPLDGTVNFAHGVPFFTVSIGYAEDGLMRLAAVYDPMRDEMFSAEAGRGAWLNGQPIKTSPLEDLDQALLVTGFAYDIRTSARNNLDLYARFALSSQGVRRLGSAALDMAYVACGRMDGFWELKLNSYDLAAGWLLVQAAGGAVTAIDGNPDLLAGPTPSALCAGTPALHAKMSQLINGG